MNWQEFIAQDSEIMMGKPVIRGTRLTVELIVERLTHGAPESDLLESYPQLRPEHVKAVQAYMRR